MILTANRASSTEEVRRRLAKGAAPTTACRIHRRSHPSENSTAPSHPSTLGTVDCRHHGARRQHGRQGGPPAEAFGGGGFDAPWGTTREPYRKIEEPSDDLVGWAKQWDLVAAEERNGHSYHSFIGGAFERI
jgi:hypothetical protein